MERVHCSAVLGFALAIVGAASASARPTTRLPLDRSPAANPVPTVAFAPTPASSAEVASRSPLVRALPKPAAADQGVAPTETNFDLTLFLFGSGFALFIGLLAWADQIRGLGKETREVVDRFLKRIGVTFAQFRRYQRATKAAERMHALDAIARSARFSDAADVNAMGRFKEWLALVGTLQNLNRRKYWLSLALTVALLASGGVSLSVNTRTLIAVGLLLLVPGVLLALLLVLMFRIGKLEDQFLEMLDDLSAMA